MLKLFSQPTTWIVIGTIIVFIGSLVIAVSGHIDSRNSSREKNKFEKELNLKNEQLLIKAEQLQEKTDMVARLSIVSAKHNAEQNEFIKKSFVGGDSFCYLSFGDHGNGLIMPFIRHKGKYPMYDIDVKLMDLDLWDIEAKVDNNEKLGSSPKYYNVGNLGPGAVRTLQTFRMQERKLVRLKADITARNGWVIEMIHGRRKDRIWLFAIKVFRASDSKVLFEEIPKSFPKDENGKYDWNVKTEKNSQEETEDKSTEAVNDN